MASDRANAEWHNGRADIFLAGEGLESQQVRMCQRLNREGPTIRFLFAPSISPSLIPIVLPCPGHCKIRLGDLV